MNATQRLDGGENPLRVVSDREPLLLLGQHGAAAAAAAAGVAAVDAGKDQGKVDVCHEVSILLKRRMWKWGARLQ